MAWQHPIYDRTRHDVVQRTKKGVLNAQDMNRIEGNIQELSSMLSLALQTRTWTEKDVPVVSDYERILANTRKIRQAYSVYPTTPRVPSTPLNHFEKFNEVERILYDVYTIFKNNENPTYYCGEFYAGEATGVM